MRKAVGGCGEGWRGEGGGKEGLGLPREHEPGVGTAPPELPEKGVPGWGDTKAEA